MTEQQKEDINVIAYLYCITNIINDEKYVGVTIDIGRRKSEHFFSKTKGSQLVYKAMQKYGKNNFKFDIILLGEEENIYSIESLYIAENNTLTPHGYNIAEGGLGGRTGPVSEATKIKMSIAHTGKPRMPHTEETKMKLSKSAIGRKTSEDVKKKMSESRQGPGNAMFGRVHSEETKEKIRLTKLGRTGPKKGIPRSEETKRKISETKRLNKLSKLGGSN